MITPSYKFPSLPPDNNHHQHHHHNHKTINNGIKVTGPSSTAARAAPASPSRKKPRCLPSIVVELSMHTNTLQKDMANNTVRLTLECEKHSKKDKIRIEEEPLWTMYCNRKKNRCDVQREAKEEDLYVMELLKAVSMGIGVLPSRFEMEECSGGGEEGELAYVRAPFEHVVG